MFKLHGEACFAIPAPARVRLSPVFENLGSDAYAGLSRAQETPRRLWLRLRFRDKNAQEVEIMSAYARKSILNTRATGGIATLAVLLLACVRAVAQDAALAAVPLDQQEKFLETGKIVSQKTLSRGVTKSIRATLTDGKLKHDAHIQMVDKQLVNLYAPDGTPVPWRDSYKYNIAAYRLLRFLGLDMTPPSVERKISGRPAAITWWADNVKMLELDRLRNKVEPPDPKDWERQMSSARVFDNLIFNIDRNLENMAITNDWKVVLIDHTRAFSAVPKLMNPEELTMCRRPVFEKIKGLSAPAIQEAVNGYLTKSEIDGIMKRRDLIVEHFKKLMAEKGEATILIP
jgi:hypothetical protein